MHILLIMVDSADRTYSFRHQYVVLFGISVGHTIMITTFKDNLIVLANAVCAFNVEIYPTLIL